MAVAIKETVSNFMERFHGHPENLPREPSAEEFQQLRKKYTDAGQGHVFAFVDELQTGERSQLFHQLSSFDPVRINELADKALNPPKADDGTASLEPLPDIATASILDSDPKDLEQWYEEGLKLVAGNKAAVVLMSG
jgi:UDP-N-acetylglucosamine/UDP-N-acetylgalactosamine diphosphorylase